jgi:[protein-PII] uridylyltransferase
MRYIFADHDKASQIRRIREGLEAYREGGSANPDQFEMHPAYDQMMAQLAEHFLGHWKEMLAIVGLGGYGRKEMSPYSDIDLLFLRQEDAPEGVYRGIRSILYLLWDAKVEFGHSVRTIAECREEADKDLAVLTSLMDTRFIWGSELRFRDLLIDRDRLIWERDPLDFYLRIEDEIQKSVERFGHTIYLLEPNVKEGSGSLRYVQLIQWLSRIVFGASKLEDLPYLGVCGHRAVEEVYEGRQFLAGVRTRLHFLAGRQDDVLRFDAQIAIAEQKGLRESRDRTAAEVFMREYYRHAATIDFFGRRIRARARLFLTPKNSTAVKQLKLDDFQYIGGGGINRYDLETLDAEPREMLRAFRHIADTGTDLDIRLADAIRTRLRTVHSRWMDDPEVNALFRELCKVPGHVSRALTAMMKTGFLELFIIEFGMVRFLRQHDGYHQYTVDLHTMKVLENMDRFATGDNGSDSELLQTMFARVEKPELLYLAGLFHDIGKGHGAGHEVRGEEIARPVLERMGLGPDEIEDVCFLIRNHLAMPHLAFKKDLHDEGMIGRFAETVMHQRRLDMLTILTFADLQAVGPATFNSWKNLLLEELYYRTLDVIYDGTAGGEELGEWIQQIKAVIAEKVPDEFQAELKAFLRDASSRYLLDFYPGIIIDHFLDFVAYLRKNGKQSLGQHDIIFQKTDNRKPPYSAITLIIQDRPGLFFRIAGAMSANRINILSAWTHSIGPDLAICTFHVNDIPDGALTDAAQWESFKADIQAVFSGQRDVNELVANRRRAGRVAAAALPGRVPLKVEINNAASDRATIVEVYAHDRPGLLYDITRYLSSEDLHIVLAKIATQTDRAADVFYVVDAQGHRIVDFERLDDIRRGLTSHLEEMEASLLEQPRSVTF